MKSCLIIIDVQKGFINEHTKDVPAKVQKLQHKYDVVFVARFYNHEDSPFRRLMDWHEFGKESDDFCLAFKPVEHAVIFDKPIYTCVSQHLLKMLDEQGIFDIALCGINTDCCVLKTAVDLFEQNYRPVVIADACGSDAGQEYHDNAIKILRRLIGDDQIN